MPKFKLVVAVMAIACLCATIAQAQDNQGTPEQRAACAPDAFRLCGSYIPDPAQVEACLRQRKSALSDACRSVFDQGDHAALRKVRDGERATTGAQ
jgi:hypothetical protein